MKTTKPLTVSVRHSSKLLQYLLRATYRPKQKKRLAYHIYLYMLLPYETIYPYFHSEDVLLSWVHHLKWLATAAGTCYLFSWCIFTFSSPFESSDPLMITVTSAILNELSPPSEWVGIPSMCLGMSKL